MISRAQSKYFDTISNQGSNNQVSKNEITSAGALLYREVNATLIVVPDAATKRIPNLTDLQTAVGQKAQAKLRAHKVVPDTVPLATKE